MDPAISTINGDEAWHTYQTQVQYYESVYCPEHDCHDGLAHCLTMELGQGTDMTKNIYRCIKCGRTFEG